MISAFIKDRNEAILSLDEQKIRAFCKKYSISLSDNPIVFWASIYKCVLVIKDAPQEARKKAEDWLDNHGFKREIDPHVVADVDQQELIERHTFEHVTFPCMFYKWGDKMFNQVVDGSRFYLADLYKHVTCNGNALQPFKPKQFNVLLRDYSSEDRKVTIVRLDLPKPTSITECRSIYLCQNEKTGSHMYFTSELSIEGTYHLCAWTKNHTHLLLSIEPVANEFDRVTELFEELADFEPQAQEFV